MRAGLHALCMPPAAESLSLKTEFTDLRISNRPHRVFEKLGISVPTPIQSRSLPEIKRQSNLQGIAQLKPGKTVS